MKQLQTLCGECAPEMIDNHFFVCYPESPSHVTYQARLEGTSERGSDSLISLIEDWVRGGPGVIVTGVLMTVDSPSLSEGECSPHSHPTSNINGPTRPTGSDDEGTTNSRGSSGSCYSTHHCYHNCHYYHSLSGVEESSWRALFEEV